MIYYVRISSSNRSKLSANSCVCLRIFTGMFSSLSESKSVCRTLPKRSKLYSFRSSDDMRSGRAVACLLECSMTYIE
jgi:hypothetical protein